MESTKQRDTPTELALRSELHRRGLRFRVDLALPGVTRSRPDIVFTRQKVAVFVDGCFWHMCPEHSSMPKANADWWREKLESNVKRDRRHDKELEEKGWCVIRVWEHDDTCAASEQIERIVRSIQSQLDRP